MNKKNFYWLTAIALAVNAIIWGIWWWKIKSDPNPFIFASGILFVNLFLANYLARKQLLSAYFISSVTIFIQVLTFIFLCFLWRGGVR